MARKLSHIAARLSFLLIAAVTSLAANRLPAQSASQVTEPAKVIENPFVFSQAPAQPQVQTKPMPQTISEPRQSAKPRAVHYQNPFASASKSPPVDTSLRPGPISRWRHPIIPSDETSTIKSAMLATPPGEPDRIPWDVLPPAEDLRLRANAAHKETDPTFYSRLTQPSNAIQFSPKPLTQPIWLTADSDGTISLDSSLIQVDSAIFGTPLNGAGFATQTAAQTADSSAVLSARVTSAFAVDSVDKSPADAKVSPGIISDCEDSPAGWLEQAQLAAAKANSPEELSAIVELCNRGMRGGPEGKLSASLRRLGAWAHNRRGEMQAEAGQSDDALADFQAAIALDPECSLAIHNRAVTLAQQNQFAAALRDFNRVIELNPGLAVAYRNRAELLAALGRMDEAADDYSQAIESLPGDANLYRGRAHAWQRLGDFQKSLADLNRAIEIAPTDPDAFTQRGNLAAEQGNYEQAITDFRQSLSIDPNWAEAHRSLGWLLATCPNPDFQDSQQAIAAAEQAANLAPANDYLILDTLAAANASMGQFERAVELQQQALANAPRESAPSLDERLNLYRNGKAFRNTASPGSSNRSR